MYLDTYLSGAITCITHPLHLVKQIFNVIVFTGDNLDFHFIYPITHLLDLLTEVGPPEHSIINSLSSKIGLAT